MCGITRGIAVALSVILVASTEFAPLSMAYANIQVNQQLEMNAAAISLEPASAADGSVSDVDGSLPGVSADDGDTIVDDGDFSNEGYGAVIPDQLQLSAPDQSGQDGDSTSENNLDGNANGGLYENDGSEESSSSAPLFSELTLPQGAIAAVVEIDESNGTVDWDAVKNAGVTRVVLSLGYEDDNGNPVLDAQWKRNISECKRLGIEYGVSFLARGSESSEIAADAQFVLNNIKDAFPSLPVFIKLSANAQIDAASIQSLSAFCQTMNASGFSAGICASYTDWAGVLSDNGLKTWDRWITSEGAETDAEYPKGFSLCGSSQVVRIKGVDSAVRVNFLFGSVKQDIEDQPNGDDRPQNEDTLTPNQQHIEYEAHVQDLGWLPVSSDGETAGTTGKALELEALKVTLKDPVVSGSVVVRAHVSDIGWQESVEDGAVAGTTGKSKPIEAVEMNLTGKMAEQFDIYYRVHVANIGWMAWAKNGENAGTQGYRYAVEAVQIQLVQKGATAPSASGSVTKEAFRRRDLAITYRGYVQDIGWQASVQDGDTAGTTGKGLHLEALSLALVNQVPGEFGQVQVNAHVSDLGWRGYGVGTAGTTGRNLSIEAVQIKLTGEISEQYDIYYRVHAANIGWMAWAKNGQSAGTEGYGYGAEAVQVVLVSVGKDAPSSSDSVTQDAFRKKPLGISYRAHVANIGWQASVENGATAGTTGRALAVEALSVALVRQDTGEEGSVRIDPYLSGKGWAGFSSGSAGTTGQNRSIQAIRAELTGEVANKFDLYYRTHVSGYGWLGWAKNGDEAGAIDLGASVEAFQFKLVKKGNEAPGSTSDAFVSAPTYSYQSVVSGSWQSPVNGGAISGTAGQNKPITNFKMSASSANVSGGVQYRVHVANVGWKSRVSSGVQAGDSVNAIQAVEISLTGDLSKKFDIWYRVHVANLGWLGWTSNGSSAGTTSCSLDAQAIQVVIRAKGVGAPGATSGSYYASIASLPYIGYQTPGAYPKVSNKTVQLPSYCEPPFNYVSPSRIPYNATRSQCIEAFVARAYEYLGTQYIEPWSTAPGGAVDCSGLVLQCLYATGMDMGWYNPYNHRWIPSQTYNSMNWYRENTFMPVTVSNLQRGDVVYYRGHIAIYIGGGTIIDSWPRLGVTIRSVNAPGSIIGAARPFP